MTREFAPGSPFALLSSVETAAWYAYMKVHLRLEYELNRQLRADSGISLADYHVLVALTSAPGGRMRVADLAIRIGTLNGAIIGAAAFLLTEEWLSGYTEHWKVIFGPLLVLVAVFVPGGLLGIATRLRRIIRG